MDVVFVSGLEMIDQAFPQYGQEIFKRIIEKDYDATVVNFNAMIANGRFSYNSDRAKLLDSAADYLASLNSRTVGFYTICDTFMTAMELTKRLKARSPETRIFYGGPHATITARECLNAIPELELVVTGESEYSILPLVKAMLEGTGYEDVKGIAYRKDGEVVFNSCYDLVPGEKLGEYTVFDFSDDYPSFKERLNLEGGRGCPFNCSFCSTSSFWKRQYRIKPVNVLISEMDRFSENGTVKYFTISHDNFTAGRKYIQEFCENLIKLERHYSWGCSSRTDCLDKELIELMARAGCKDVYVGVETGSPRMQEIIRKNLNIPDALSKISMLADNGINVCVSLIFGFPDETMEDFDETLKIFGDIYLAGARNVQLHRFFPLPATKEADKVRDRLYFDKNDIERTIFKKDMLTDEDTGLIRQYPELFMPFYTFESETRTVLPWIEGMATFPYMCRKYFEGSLRYLIRKYGFKGMYLKYEDVARRIQEHLEKADYNGSVMPETMSLIKEIVERENDRLLNELFRFEAEWTEYCRSGTHATELKTYGIKAMTAEKTGEIIEEESYVLFYADDKTGISKATPMPPELIKAYRANIRE